MVCPVDKPFLDNGKFSATTPRKQAHFVRMCDNKRLFPHIEWYYTGDYKYHIGPSFHNGLAYWRCDETGLWGSFCRLACKRFLDVDPTGGLHDIFAENQAAYFQYNALIRTEIKFYMLDKLEVRYADLDVDGAREAWVYAPHPKKKERVTAYQKLMTEGASHYNKVFEVEYVSKSQEWLPRDKYLRGTGNLGVVSAIAGGYLASHIKDVMKETMCFGQVCLSFVTVVHEEISELFHKLGSFDQCVIGFFSDDGVISARCSDGQLRANLDISQCDGSMGQDFLSFVRECIRIDNWGEDIDELFRQLTLPMRLRHPLDRSRSILLLNNTMVLYSGSTLTTICNNFVHICIAHRFSKVYSPDNTIEANKYLYERCAFELGFKVKVQMCTRMLDYQFLKMTPVSETYIVNIACHLRGFGFSKGDIPGKRRGLTLEQVGVRFLASIVQGRLNWGHTTLLDAFIEKYGAFFSGRVAKEGTVRDDITRPKGRFIPDYEWLPRYDVTEACYHDFLNMFRAANVGDCLHHPFIDAVMKKDY